MKKEVFIVFFGIVLCTCFGMGYLFLFSDQPDKIKTNEISNNSIHVFVNQVGVYSTMDNVLEAGQELIAYQENYHILEKNEQYVLLSLISLSEEVATSQKNKLENLGFNVFMKEYDVPASFQSSFENQSFEQLLKELESR